MSSAVLDEKQTESRIPPSGPVTFEEFLAWCDEDTPAEWNNGVITIKPSESADHQDLSGFLSSILGIYVQEGNLGKLFTRFLMYLATSHSAREPDLLFVTHKRLTSLQTYYLDGPADLVVEIISPESIGRDRGDKFVEYEAAGIREYWLIDPLREQVEFYQLNDQGLYRAAALDADGVYQSIVLTGFWLRVEWLWQSPLPPVLGVLKELGVI